MTAGKTAPAAPATDAASDATIALERHGSRAPRAAKYQRPPWQGRPSAFAVFAKGLTMVMVCAAILVPLLIVVSTSLASPEQLARSGGYVIIPTDISFRAYEAILSGGVVTRSVLVSIGVTVVGTALSLISTTLIAYALSRPGSLFHGPILGFILLTFLFSPGIIPVYLMVKELGLLNQYASLILPVAVNAFNIVIVRGFFMNVPAELLDAARIDGASEWRIFSRIMLPLSRAVIAVVGLFYAVSYWNAFFQALLYLQDSAKWPLQLVLRTYVLQGAPLVVDTGSTTPPPAASVQMAVIVIAVIPILCVYPFLQRHMTKGVLTGAVKG
ncbi:ABC transporter permease [Brachybacterium avium]|uniref:ABC transporter permease n=1 Tax=Brachybacterium avium TaxID=2017485 RepID=A0A220UBT4_9MICO|nr:carbohydrate ABC transporter permease [Brachybacterium avium]ASK65577.1 ABC transporter permease [Brachybacterium avium]